MRHNRGMNITTTVKHTSSSESEEIITSYVNSHPQGVITTISKDGVPQSSVVNLFQINNYHMAFMTKRTSRKFTNLAANQAVAFLTYDPFSRTEVEIEGIAHEVKDKGQEADILQVIAEDAVYGRRHISPYVSEADDYVLFIIYPRKMHMTTYWERSKGIEVFHESIEFELKKA